MHSKCQLACKFSLLFSSTHGKLPEARVFSERIVKQNLSFQNMIKLFVDKDSILPCSYSRLT